MWHEARKQEKKIRGMMVDFKRRAERRRDYYERIKQDPAQFLQVHGRPAKIHLDPAIAVAADSPATMMPWQGNPNNLIDRFDVRAHLDIIPEYKPTIDLPKLSGEELIDDRKACYERYRTLVQNDFLGLNEDKFLHQIFLEERFGPVMKPAGEEDKKKLMDKKAAIGYVYEDSTSYDPPPLPIPAQSSKALEEFDDDEDKDDLSDIDLDVTVDVSELSLVQCAEMNEHSHKYGMTEDDFIAYLMEDKDEADQLRLAREIEEEKAMFSGRNSRRERRALREKKLAGRKITSPPSYAARESPTYTPVRHSTSKSRSRSKSPPNAGKIMFITSFGDEASDGEAGGHKTGNSSPRKDSRGVSAKKQNNCSKSAKDTSQEIVIGPLLREEMESKKTAETNYRKNTEKRSVSSSGSSSSRSRKMVANSRNDATRHNSPPKSKRRRHSSSSSSSSYDRRRRQCSKRRYSRSRSSSRESRSRSLSSRSRSRSQSYRRPRGRRSTESRSRSKSRSPKKSASPQLPPPPVKSYYRHSLSRSTSDVSDDSDSQDKKEDSGSGRNSSLANKSSQLLTQKAGPSTQSKFTPQERLKRRMQIALNRQYKADKRAQMQKSEKQLQEKMDREEELREMAIKLRQRERERRHKLRGYGYDSDSDGSFTKWERDDNDNHHQTSKSSRDRGRSRHHSSSDDERPSKEPEAKRHRRSPTNDRRKNSPVAQSSSSHRRSETGSRRSRSPGRRKTSPHRSRSDNRHRSRESRRSRTRSPRRRATHESSSSSYRKDRRSRSPARSHSRTNSNKNSRSLVDY